MKFKKLRKVYEKGEYNMPVSIYENIEPPHELRSYRKSENLLIAFYKYDYDSLLSVPKKYNKQDVICIKPGIINDMPGLHIWVRCRIVNVHSVASDIVDDIIYSIAKLGRNDEGVKEIKNLLEDRIRDTLIDDVEEYIKDVVEKNNDQKEKSQMKMNN